MDTVSTSDRVMVHVYRALGLLCCVGLIAYVYKQGWHLSGMIWPFLLAVLLFSLGANPARKSPAWAIRYIITLLVALFVLGAVIYRYFQSSPPL